MKIKKYLMFTILPMTIFTACATAPKQDVQLSKLDYKEHNEISLEQYENVENYNLELKKLQYSSGLKNIPREILDAQVEIKKVSKDKIIDKSEYLALNIDYNLKKYRFKVEKLVRIENLSY